MNFTEYTKVRKEKFGTVVFDTLTEKIFITDQIGGEILSMLCDNYDGDERMIEKDVLDFTDELKSNNIINV